MRDAHENATTLLLHLLSASASVTILAFSDVDRLQTDIMVRADVRVTYHVKLERVLTLGERKLELDVQALRDGDALNRQQLPRALLASHDTLIHHLLSGEVRRHDEDIALIFLVICVAAQRDL
jgi:hypothetical protein